MDQHGLNARAIFIILFINQVCASPTYYWTQLDCSQQNNDGLYNSYDSYQGPSYEETLQAMVDETLRAIRDMVQVTVKATKQELAALYQIFYNSLSYDCNSSSEPDTGEGPGEYELNDVPVEIEDPPETSMGNGYIYPVPQNSPVGLDNLESVTSEKSCNDSKVPDLENKVGTGQSSSKPVLSSPGGIASNLGHVESPLGAMGDKTTTAESSKSDQEETTQSTSTDVDSTSTTHFATTSEVPQHTILSTERGTTSPGSLEIMRNETLPIHTSPSDSLDASEVHRKPISSTVEITTSLPPSDIHPGLLPLANAVSGMKTACSDCTTVEPTPTNDPDVSSLVFPSGVEVPTVNFMTLVPDVTTEGPTSINTDIEKHTSDPTALEVPTKPTRKSKL